MPKAAYSEIAKDVETSTEIVTAVAEGMQNRISSLDDTSAKLAITGAIRAVALDYGGNNDIAAQTLAECIRLVQSEFAFLGVNEIRIAYRQWAVNKTDAGKRGEMYGGQINAAQVGAVLSAYVEKRRQVVKALTEAAHAAKDAQDKERRTEAAKARFWQDLQKAIGAARAGGVTDWRQVPYFWYQSLKKRGYINFEPGEAQTIYEEAKELAVIEAGNRVEVENGIRKIEAMREYERIIGELEPNEAKTIAQRLSVFRKVIINKDFKF